MSGIIPRLIGQTFANLRYNDLITNQVLTKNNDHQIKSYCSPQKRSKSHQSNALFQQKLPYPNIYFNLHQIQVFSETKVSKRYQIQKLQYTANQGIEDRIVISKLTTYDIDVIAVFDGHGGDMLSQYCEKNITIILDEYLKMNRKRDIYKNDIDKLLCDALTKCYQKLENDFYQNVYKTLQGIQSKRIKGVGSCALTILIYKGKLYVANSGDSQAIGVFKDEDQLKFKQLNQRFSVNNPKERERLKKQFPNDQDIVVQQKTGCFYLKGRLQPTRSLGDYHLKYPQLFKGRGEFNGPYLKCEPNIQVFTITPDLQKVVIASDGIWDFLKKKQVAEASLEQRPHEAILDRTFKKIASFHKKTIEEIKDLDPDIKRSYHDDISIAVVSFFQYQQ